MAEPLAQMLPTSNRDGAVRWWDVAIAFFGGSFIGIAFATLVGAAGIAIAMRYGFHPTAQNVATLLRTGFSINQAGIVLSDLGLLGVIWLVARRRFARPTAHFFAPAGLTLLLAAMLSGVAVSILFNGGNEVLAKLLHFKMDETDIERAIEPHGAIQIAVALAVVALFAPFVEEYFFRGLFFTWVRQKGGAWVATLITGGAFALAHGQFYFHPGAQGLLFTLELFGAGVGLAQWAARTGSLRTSFAAHAAYNAAAIVFSVLSP